MREQRISAGAAAHGLRVERDIPTSRYEVADIFTSHYGDWDQVSTFGVPGWARAAYLRPYGAPDYFDEAGGDHHLFIRVETEDRDAIGTDVEFLGGAMRDTSNTGIQRSGWSNLPVYAGGRWRWGPLGGPHVAGGNPGDGHISCFAVFVPRVGVPIPEPEPAPMRHWWVVLDVEQTASGLTVVDTTVTEQV